MIDGGQALVDKVTAQQHRLLIDRVTAYAPILLTAEDAITGSVRVDDERIRAETLGLSRAVGARGLMMMEQLLVNLGGELPDPELRSRLITVAGTEPSTLFGMSPGTRRRLAGGQDSCSASTSSAWRSCPIRTCRCCRQSRTCAHRCRPPIRSRPR